MAFSVTKRSSDGPPTHPPKLPSDQDYRQGLRLSLGLHAALLVLFLIKSLVFPGNPLPFVPTLRVDIVGLPDALKSDLKNLPSTKEVSKILKQAELEAQRIKPVTPPKTEIKPEEIAKPDELVLHPKPTPTKQLSKKAEKEREKRLKSALDRMKALAKISNEDKKPGVLIQGNKISKGNSLSGEAKESDQSNYYDDVLQRLKDNWALPVWLSRQNFSAQVQIFIDASGRLHGYRFVKFSGNSHFDDAIKRSLEESAPFPAPPREISASVLVNGIVFGFPL